LGLLGYLGYSNNEQLLIIYQKIKKIFVFLKENDIKFLTGRHSGTSASQNNSNDNLSQLWWLYNIWLGNDACCRQSAHENKLCDGAKMAIFASCISSELRAAHFSCILNSH